MSRILTALVGIPIVLALVYWSPTWMFAAAVGAIGCMAFGEFISLWRTRGLQAPRRWTLAVSFLVTVSFGMGAAGALAGLAAGALVLIAVSIASDPIGAVVESVAAGLTGLLYVSFLLGFILLLPRPAVLVLLGIVWVGDTAAYYGGRRWGRRPLARTLSPKKTIEGAAAGAAGSILAGVILSTVLLGAPVASAALISLGVGAAGQVGDLAESAFKRNAGVKDSGARLPGHGGFLDRIDSLLFAAPVFLILSQA